MVAEAPVRKRKVGERGPETPVMVRMKARTLYLNECLPIKVIAERCGLTPATISRMAHKEKWTVVRRQQKERIIAKQDAQGDTLLAQAIEQIRNESIELCKPALDSVRSGFDTGGLNGAKQAQAASAALKNLATSFRALNESSDPSDQPSVVAFNLFFAGRPEAAKPEQVTEVEAKTVQ